jgi:predicted CoA-binding protein
MHPNVVVSAEGIKTEAQADQPAYYVPRYCVDAGFDVVPVPVYDPEATDSFAEKLAAAGIKVVQDRCVMVELRSRAR